MAVLNYNPRNSQLVWGGKLAQGFADGTFINLVRNSDQYSLVVGADGVGTRVKSNNFSGRITVTLQHTSPTNDDWNAFVNLDELSDDGALPLFFKSGNVVATAVTAWCVKRPDAEYSNSGAINRVWVLETDYLVFSSAAG